MQRQAGFTLTELMITIAVIAILLSVAIPNYIGKLPAKRMQSALSQIQGALHTARLEAVKANSKAIVDFDVSNEIVSATVGGSTVSRAEMPGDVDLVSVERTGTSASESSITFDSRGLITCSDGTSCSIEILLDAGSSVDAHCIGLSLSGNSKLFRNNCP